MTLDFKRTRQLLKKHRYAMGKLVGCGVSQGPQPNLFPTSSTQFVVIVL